MSGIALCLLSLWLGFYPSTQQVYSPALPNQYFSHSLFEVAGSNRACDEIIGMISSFRYLSISKRWNRSDFACVLIVCLYRSDFRYHLFDIERYRKDEIENHFDRDIQLAHMQNQSDFIVSISFDIEQMKSKITSISISKWFSISSLRYRKDEIILIIPSQARFEPATIAFKAVVPQKVSEKILFRKCGIINLPL